MSSEFKYITDTIFTQNVFVIHTNSILDKMHVLGIYCIGEKNLHTAQRQHTNRMSSTISQIVNKQYALYAYCAY